MKKLLAIAGVLSPAALFAQAPTGVAADLTDAIATGTTVFNAAVVLGLAFLVWRIGRRAIGSGL